MVADSASQFDGAVEGKQFDRVAENYYHHTSSICQIAKDREQNSIYSADDSP